MHFYSSLLVAAGLIARALSQTPPGTQPSTSNNLAVTYGNTQVTPGIKLPETSTSTIPTFMHVPSSSNQTFSLLLVDLSISTKTLETGGLVQGVQLPLAPGIMANRTTRLHYWQPGVTFSANGALVNMTEPIAFYQGPAPPSGDIAHTYVFYLFEQNAGFMAPAAGNPFSQALVNEGMNRMSFNVGNLAKENGIGSLTAANYIMVQNTKSDATATGAASATGTGSAMTPSGSSFTGGAGKPGMGMMEGLATALAVGLAVLL